MINGGHVILYSKDAEADKEFIKKYCSSNMWTSTEAG